MSKSIYKYVNKYLKKLRTRPSGARKKMYDSNLKAMHRLYFEHAEVCVPSIEHATVNIHIDYNKVSNYYNAFLQCTTPSKDI